MLPCKLRSNLAQRRWHYSDSASQFLYATPEGNLVVVAQTDRVETYECWSEEEGFRQLLANYCVRAEPRHESTTLIGHSRTPHIEREESIILPGESRSEQVHTKTYWNELIVVCALLAFSLVVFSLFVIYRNRDHMKSMLKQGECPNMQQKKPRIVGKPAESLPLNGNTIPVSTSDHKGYQTLNDNYICSTPTHESSPDNSKSFSESSDRRPLNLKESHVEYSPTCPRPRVRLGSEIKDSIVWECSIHSEFHPVSPWRIQATKRWRGEPDIPIHHSTSSFSLVISFLWSVRRSFCLTISTPKPEVGPVLLPVVGKMKQRNAPVSVRITSWGSC